MDLKKLIVPFGLAAGIAAAVAWSAMEDNQQAPQDGQKNNIQQPQNSSDDDMMLIPLGNGGFMFF